MKEKKNNIYITIDYELFMGRKTGSVLNCMIYPLDKLLVILEKYNIKITIFVDAAYLLKLSMLKNEYESLQNDYTLITNQLKKMSVAGHDIQLHIHPQWLHATYDGVEWKLKSEHYKLSDLDSYEAQLLFKKSKEILEKIINKTVVAFRAGGYSIQTYKNYPKLLLTNGIKIDSSVLTGATNKGPNQSYDYRDVVSSNHYNFDENILVPNKNGHFIELPITRLKIKPMTFLLTKLLVANKYDHKRYGDGFSVNELDNQIGNKKIFMKVLRILFNNYQTASIDSMNAAYLKTIFNESKGKNDKDFVIIGHPKNFTDFSLFHFEKFLYKIIQNTNFLIASDLLNSKR